jgi:hypothetical protein
VKRALTILFLLALAFSQPLALLATDCSGPLPCCGCGGKMKCCVAEADSSPANAPAVPAPSFTQDNFQLLQLLPPGLMLPFSAPDCRVTPQIVAAAPAGAVPIFTRDCAFLI